MDTKLTLINSMQIAKSIAIYHKEPQSSRYIGIHYEMLNEERHPT